MSIKQILFTILLIFLVAFGAYFIYIYLEESKEEMNKRQRAIEQQTKLLQSQNSQKQSKQSLKTHIVLDNNIYSNNFNNIAYSINMNYRDVEFTKNLEPFFTNLTNIEISKNDRVYEFEIKGYLSKSGNFTYSINKRTNITEYDSRLIKELDRLKGIKFNEQKKDVDFYLTVTNRYNLIK